MKIRNNLSHKTTWLRITRVLVLIFISLVWASLKTSARTIHSRRVDLNYASSKIFELIVKAGDLGFQDQYDEAIVTLKQALDEWEKIKASETSSLKWSDDLLHSELLRRLGILYYAKGNYKNAEKFYLQSMSIKEKSFSTRGLPFEQALQNDLLRIGLIYQAEGKMDKAISSLSRANAQLEQLFYDDLFESTNEDGRLSQEQIFISDATNMTLSFYLRSAPKDSNAATLALETVLRRKGRVLDSIVSNTDTLLKFVRPEDRPLLDQYLDARSRHRKLLNSLNSANAAQVIGELAKIEQELENLTKQLDQRITYFYHDWHPLKLSDVQSRLSADDAWIEFVSYIPFNEKAVRNSERWLPRHYAACVLRKDQSPHCEDLGDALTIDDSMANLHCHFQFGQGQPELLTQDLQRVYRLLFDKIEKYLSDTHTWLIAADGSLNIIAFGALIDHKNDYVIEKHSIRYFTNALDFLRAQFPSRKGGAPLVLANPDFNIILPSDHNDTAQCCVSESYTEQTWDPAPSTDDLAKHIKISFPKSNVYMNGAASKAALNQVSCPGILVLATHGFYLPPGGKSSCPPADEPVSSEEKVAQGSIWGKLYTDPAGPSVDSGLNDHLLCSGVALAGANNHRSLNCNRGILNARTVYRMNLWGTQLVVLAACQTGQGGESVGEGIYGLRRAFVIAGAESQVLALWSVNAEATDALISSYFSYLSRGEGRAEALRKSQLDMLTGERKEWRNPAYWAGFIESGAWTPLTPSLFAE